MLQIVNLQGHSRPLVLRQPAPAARPGHVLIANAASLVSAGTEKSTIELAGRSLLGKARARPDQVRQALEKARQEGVPSAVRAVRARLDEPLALGYASAGIVLEAGEGVQTLKPGDRVASNGPHAGVVSVPKHLCARVPDEVPLEHGAFAVLGAIALHGVRLSRAALGETALVIGLGLIGQLTVSLLKAAGCRVIGTDPDDWKCRLAAARGACLARPGLTPGDVEAATGGLGADAAIVAASTRSRGPIDLAGQAVRQKGRVVLVGVAGLELDRRAFYAKEAELVVSRSYGPGRYDPAYEEGGRDYPPAYVRWTEQRNLQAVLDMMAAGALDVGPLVTHRFPIDRAGEAYDLIDRGAEPYLAVVLQYPDAAREPAARQVRLAAPGPKPGRVGVGVLGAGQYARTTLLPALAASAGLRPVSLCSAGGLSAAHYGPKFGFETASSDEAATIGHPDVGAVFVLTRHHQHAAQAVRALEAGRHVYVEKPLCLTLDELDAIDEAVRGAGDDGPVLMVGFNRRFAPAVGVLRDFFRDATGPLTISIRFNAGRVPRDHWTQDPEVGGGRIVGEACHAIDLATCLAGSPPVRVFAESIGGPRAPAPADDQCFITLRHANGAVSSVAYLAGGTKACPKERIEVVGGGRVGAIDDFRRVTLYADRTRRTKRYWSQDKGHAAAIAAFAKAIRGETPPPIPFEELRAVAQASILAVRSLREGQPQELGIPRA